MEDWDCPGVYGIYCIPARRVYVGMAWVSIEKRIEQHLQRLEKGEHSVPELQVLYDAYGDEGITVGVISIETNRYELLGRERAAKQHYAERGWLLNNRGDMPGRYRVRKRRRPRQAEG